MTKRTGKEPELPQILRWLSVLDKNDMNQAKTARECGVSRSSIRRYQEKYWDVYLSEKETTKEEARGIAANKIFIEQELEKMRKEILVPFRKVINEMCTRLDSDDQLKRIPFKLLIEAFREMAPYLAEKQGTLGVAAVNNNDPGAKYTSVVNNIIQNMKIGSDNN